VKRIKKKEEDIAGELDKLKQKRINVIHGAQNQQETSWGQIDAVLKTQDDVKMLEVTGLYQVVIDCNCCHFVGYSGLAKRSMFVFKHICLLRTAQRELCQRFHAHIQIYVSLLTFYTVEDSVGGASHARCTTNGMCAKNR